jgi:hypothetical protein
MAPYHGYFLTVLSLDIRPVEDNPNLIITMFLVGACCVKQMRSARVVYNEHASRVP